MLEGGGKGLREETETWLYSPIYEAALPFLEMVVFNSHSGLSLGSFVAKAFSWFDLFLIICLRVSSRGRDGFSPFRVWKTEVQRDSVSSLWFHSCCKRWFNQVIHERHPGLASSCG